MGRLRTRKLRGMGDSGSSVATPGPGAGFGGSLINYTPLGTTVMLPYAIYQDATSAAGASPSDLLANAFWYGPLNSLGLRSTPLTPSQLATLAAQETGTVQAAQLGVPLTPAQQAQVQSDVQGGAAIAPDVVDLSALTGILPTPGTTNWVLIFLLLAGLAGGAFVFSKISA
jgi:hypothetical protein